MPTGRRTERVENMEENRERNMQILSGSMLKLIAIVSMFIDHFAAVMMTGDHPVIYTPVFYMFGKKQTLYMMMRYVGRIAFPIFCFLLVEGFLHTRDRKKYGINLLVFALISELPFDLAFDGVFGLTGQNVFFTLFLGYLGMCVIERYRDERLKQAGLLLLLLGVSILFKADYGCIGFGLVIMFYLLRESRLYQAVLCCCFMPYDWITALSFIPIALYNGERGFIKGKFAKYAFYAFYPVHLTALYLIKSFSTGY